MNVLERLRAIWNAPGALANHERRIAQVEDAVGVGQSVNIDIRPMTHKHMIVMVGQYKNADHVEM